MNESERNFSFFVFVFCCVVVFHKRSYKPRSKTHKVHAKRLITKVQEINERCKYPSSLFEYAV